MLDVSGALPKSFVVCDHPYHTQIVYLSQLNPSTLQKRAESATLEFLADGSLEFRRLRARAWPADPADQPNPPFGFLGIRITIVSFIQGKEKRAGNAVPARLFLPCVGEISPERRNLHG